MQNKTEVTQCPYQVEWVKNGKGKQYMSTYVSIYKQVSTNKHNGSMNKMAILLYNMD